MELTDPVVVYNAESNIDANQAQHFLESEDIVAFAVDDVSAVGFSSFGVLSEIHKPQVWVNRHDMQRAAELLEEYKQRKVSRNTEAKVDEDEDKKVSPIEALCEDCNKSSTFAGSLNGTTQDCPHCGSFLDVGEYEWPYEDDFGIDEDSIE